MQLKAKKQILMSAPKYQLIITQLAKQDFRDVISYTLQIWGKQQSQNYAQKINTALNAICDNPDIGRKKHWRLVYGAGRHQIYYKKKSVKYGLFVFFTSAWMQRGIWLKP